MNTNALDLLQTPKVLVVGDIMLDIFVRGTTERISPEAPVPVISNVKLEKFPGGAANVAVNCVALGMETTLFGICGVDHEGAELLSLLKKQGVSIAGKQIATYETTTKTRYISQGQQLLRVDNEQLLDTCSLQEEEIRKRLDDEIAQADVIILSDYNKGMNVFFPHIIKYANEQCKTSIVDPKVSDVKFYQGASWVKPNSKEINLFVSDKSLKSLTTRMAQAKKQLRCDNIMLTMGAEGISILDAIDDFASMNALSREVFDVTGAGDTVTATLAMCAHNNLPSEQILTLCNVAASIAVSKHGTTSVKFVELYMHPKSGLARQQHSLHEFLLSARQQDQKIVFTNGCFDLLHRGHLDYLRRSKSLGDKLIVGVNADISVKRLKGAQRPINDEHARKEMLEALEFVDFVVLFDEDTPISLIEDIRPDFLTKGGDYEARSIVGYDFVSQYGGEVHILPYTENLSSTNLIERIKTT